jgi:hypothetical protein
MIADLRHKAQQHLDEAVSTLVDIMKNSKKDSARIAAVQILLDRGFGRVPAQDELLRDEDDDFSKLSDGQLLRLAESAMRVLERSPGGAGAAREQAGGS